MVNLQAFLYTTMDMKIMKTLCHIVHDLTTTKRNNRMIQFWYIRQEIKTIDDTRWIVIYMYSYLLRFNHLLNIGIDLLYSYWVIAIFTLFPFCTLLPFVAPCNRNQRSKMWRKQRMSRLGGDSILSCKNRSRGKKWFILFWNRNSNKLLIIVIILISHSWNIR